MLKLKIAGEVYPVTAVFVLRYCQHSPLPWKMQPRRTTIATNQVDFFPTKPPPPPTAGPDITFNSFLYVLYHQPRYVNWSNPEYTVCNGAI